MATGSGPLGMNPGGINRTEITPGADMPNVADDWARIGQTFDRFAATLAPTVKERARMRGAEMGAAAARGDAAYKSPAILNEFTAAYEDGARAAYVSGVRNDIDVREREIRSQFLYDPEGYKRAVDGMVSGFTRGAPGPLAVDVEAYARDRTARGLETVISAASERQTRETINTVNARTQALQDDMLDMVAAGEEGSEDYAKRRDELEALEVQRIANPVFGYTVEQSALAREAFDTKVQGAVLTREATAAYTAAGGGAPGYAAAKRLLSEALVDGRGPPATGAAAAGARPFREPDARAAVDSLLPGAVITSGKRSAAHNADVGGAPRSYHLTGQAVDIVPPAGVSFSAFKADLAAKGLPVKELLDEGDHWHWAFAGSAPAPELAGGPPVADTPTPPILDTIPAGKRLRLYRDASANLDAIYAGDRATRAAEAQQRADEARVQREATDSWRLRIVMGEAGEAEIQAAQDLDPGQKATLIASAKAQARAARATERAETAASKAEAATTYNQYADQARAGTLSEGDIADAVSARVLAPGQAATLRAMRDKGLKPVIGDVMAPFDDEAKRRGRIVRGTAVLRAQAEEQATRWARENPNATLEERLKAGQAIAGAVFKAPAASSGGPAAAQNGTLARLRALDAERARTRMSQSEYLKRRKAIMDAP